MKKVKVSPAVKRYITDIVRATRDNDVAVLGVSPRGSITLYKASKAVAFIDGRDFVTPDDVKFIADSVLSHRIILSVKGKTKYKNSSGFVNRILSTAAVPIT